MNIDTLADERLRSAVQSTYNDRNFAGAILDSIFFLSNLIREKTGLESDGASLAGQAFGGNSPKLKVNKLETESVKNIQAGVEQLLRGLYQAVRNPRSHHKHVDTQEDADAIIIFINYLVRTIDQSKAPFTKSEFLKRVFDPAFVEMDRYAELLTSEIPPKHRVEVMLDVVRSRETGDSKKLRYFVSALLAKLTKEQQQETFRVISDELKITDSEGAIRTILQLFPDDLMLHLDESARLRTENKLIQSIIDGRFDESKKRCSAGALGTWLGKQCNHFQLKDRLVEALTAKLSSTDTQQQAYLFGFFWSELVGLATPPTGWLKLVIITQLKAGNKRLYDALDTMRTFGNARWMEPFKAEFDSFKEQPPETPKEQLFNPDDIPF